MCRRSKSVNVCAVDCIRWKATKRRVAKRAAGMGEMAGRGGEVEEGGGGGGGEGGGGGGRRSERARERARAPFLDEGRGIYAKGGSAPSGGGGGGGGGGGDPPPPPTRPPTSPVAIRGAPRCLQPNTQPTLPTACIMTNTRTRAYPSLPAHHSNTSQSSESTHQHSLPISCT